MPALPAASIPSPPTPVLAARQATVTVFAEQSESSATLSGGAIAGIVIGSIVGFLLLVWLIWSCMRLGAPPSQGGVGEQYGPGDPVCRSCSPHPHHHHHGHGHSHSRHRSRSGRHHHPRREVTEVTSMRPVVVDRTRSVSVGEPRRAHTRGRSRSSQRGYYV